MSIFKGFLSLFFLVPLMSACSRPTESAYDPDQYYNPVPQIPVEGATSTGSRASSKSSSNTLELIETTDLSIIRVSIFPHIGRFSQPQGKETILNQVTLRATSGECRMTNAQTGATLEQGNVLILKASEITSEVLIDCEKTAKLERGAGLVAFEYRGQFLVKAERPAKGAPFVRVILQLPFEEYLRGVVPAEMPASWTMEALKAQAVAARTYALYQFTRLGPASDDYHFDDTILYQAFLGVTRENSRTDEAIRLTESQILTYGQKPIQSFFSADSGGYTEAAENVWKKSFPYCPSKAEVYDLNLVRSDWDYSTTLEDIEKILRAAGLIKGKSQLLDFKIKNLNSSGRASTVTLHFTDGSSADHFGADIQMALRLKSNLYSLAKSQNVIQFKGKGFGHGVGMNQWGARVLADSKKWNYKQILSFYYSP